MSYATLRRIMLVLLTAVFAAGPLSRMNALAQSAASGNGQSQPAGQTLSLSMQQAVDMAMDANLGLKASRLSPQMAAQDSARARSVFNPNFSGGFSRNTKDQIPSSFVESTSAIVSSNNLGVSGQINQTLPWYGSSYQVSWNAGRNETTALSNFNPQLSSSISATFIQPLLRGFRFDSARVGVKTAARAQQIADVQLSEQTAQTERATRLAYLNLISAIETRTVAQQNLEVSNQSLRNTRARVEVGLTPQADVVSAEADVASNEEALILAEGRIESSMDQLRGLILDPTRPDYWSVRIVPTDKVTVQPPTIDLDAAMKAAMAQRSDLIVARKQLEITSLNVNLLHNSTLPQVDLRVNYIGSGLAGTQFQYDNSFPPQILSQNVRGFGSALGDTFNNAYPSWTYGVQVNYPIGKSDAEASYARAQLAKRQTELQLRELEQQIATEVRDAARQVDTNYKRVLATRTALDSQVKRQDAEQKRFDVGLSDTFKLFQIQRDVAAARVTELIAELAYAQALIQFDAVQKIR